MERSELRALARLGSYPPAGPLVRTYRRTSSGIGGNDLIMLWTGTNDNTIASHYVLLHPGDAGSPDEDDPELLDPAMPANATYPRRHDCCGS